MKNFNELALLKFTEAMKHVDSVFDGSFHGSIRFLDQARADCRLIREIVEAMIELTKNGRRDQYRLAFIHYKLILAIWILIYEPSILDESRVRTNDRAGQS